MESIQTELLTGLDLHTKVIQGAVLGAETYVWIATANFKDMHIRMSRGRYKPILEVFEEMAKRGVSFRVIHSDLPSKQVRETLERLPRLIAGGMEMQICPRSHWKMIIVDGQKAYTGSANFTGAGLGVKSEQRRNLEIGIYSTQKTMVSQLQIWFDSFWMGKYCKNCGFKKQCPDPIVASNVKS